MKRVCSSKGLLAVINEDWKRSPVVFFAIQIRFLTHEIRLPISLQRPTIFRLLTPSINRFPQKVSCGCSSKVFGFSDKDWKRPPSGLSATQTNVCLIGCILSARSAAASNLFECPSLIPTSLSPFWILTWEQCQNYCFCFSATTEIENGHQLVFPQHNEVRLLSRVIQVPIMLFLTRKRCPVMFLKYNSSTCSSSPKRNKLDCTFTYIRHGDRKWLPFGLSAKQITNNAFLIACTGNPKPKSQSASAALCTVYLLCCFMY